MILEEEKNPKQEQDEVTPEETAAVETPAEETAADTDVSPLVGAVLRHVNDLVKQATKEGTSEEDVSRLGSTYFNPITDYFMQCAMPLPDGGDVYNNEKGETTCLQCGV